jgi:GWxTD domain-containing protein
MWIVGLGVVGVVGAQGPTEGWAAGPFAVLLTAEERQEWQACETAEARADLVELLWARRDPDLGVPGNPVREEIERRVAVADEELGEGDVRGALTDRGQVFVTLGVPTDRTQALMADYLARLYHEPPARAGWGPRDRLDSASDRYVTVHGESFNVDRGKADVWAYDRSELGVELPEAPDRLKTVTCVFFDRDGEGAFELSSRVLNAKWCRQAMAAKAAQLVVHPELDEVPGLALVEGLEPASSEHVSWLQAAADWPDAAAVLASRGVAVPGRYPLWLAVSWQQQDAAPRPDTLIGWLRTSEQTEVGSFVRPLEDMKPNGLLEMAVPAPAGGGSLEMVLAADGEPLARREVEVPSAPAADEAPFISPVFAGVVAGQMPEYDAGAPFVFGGYHLSVRPDGVFAAGEDMAYFGLVANPGRDADGSPLVTVALELKSGAKTVTSSMPEAVRLSEVAPGVVMFGKQLPLSAFPRGQRYRLRVTVRDEVSELSRTTTVPITLPAGG